MIAKDTPRRPLTQKEALTLAGAYADLVFGAFAPEFVADIAAALLHEETRQASRNRSVERTRLLGSAALDVESAQFDVAKAQADQARVRQTCQENTLDHTYSRIKADKAFADAVEKLRHMTDRFRALVESTKPSPFTGDTWVKLVGDWESIFRTIAADTAPRCVGLPAPRATVDQRICAALSPESFACDAAIGHKDWHAAHLAYGPIRMWKPDPSPSPEKTVSMVPAEAAVIGAGAVALRAALAVVDPHEAGPWEHAWRAVKDLEDCASRAEAIAPTETGGWDTWDAVPENVTVVSSFLDHRYCKVDGEVFRVLEDGKRHKAADFTPADMRSFAPFVADEGACA